MKNITIVFIALISVSAFAASDPAVDELKSKYSIVEGNYKLISGSSENCVAGEYQVFKGKAGVLSLKADGGLMAKNIHSEVANFREKNCSMNYTTRVILGGFENVEAVNCANSKVSYTRTFKAKFSGKRLQYKLSSHRIVENIKSEVNCLLELVEN